MRRLLACGALVLLVAVSSSVSGAGAAEKPALHPGVALSHLDGTTPPAAFTLVVDVRGATSATLVVDGQYVGQDQQRPLRFKMSLTPGEHRVKVRTVVRGKRNGTDATVTVAGNGGSGDAAKPSPATTTSPPPSATAPANGASAQSGAGTTVNSVDAIRSALSSAQPGDVIHVADGEYTFKPRLVASASGTASAPITLQGSRAAVLRTKNASGDYGLSITGRYWHIEGITVAHGSKGIVLDGSVGTVIDGVEVYDIGDEGVHFRSCSSDGVLRNSFIHDTGRNGPQYGEGVYVGSANSNWSKYQCTDPVERQTTGDNTERVLIENNVFQDVTA